MGTMKVVADTNGCSTRTKKIGTLDMFEPKADINAGIPNDTEIYDYEDCPEAGTLRLYKVERSLRQNPYSRKEYADIVTNYLLPRKRGGLYVRTSRTTTTTQKVEKVVNVTEEEESCETGKSGAQLMFTSIFGPFTYVGIFQAYLALMVAP